MSFYHHVKESVELVLTGLHTADKFATRSLPEHAMLSLEGTLERISSIER